ncbi:uncharacterized protein LY79DRAFT_388739 [Colletotrichum navitas]|uniref:Peptidase A2 domain-containing protein n=1 Tax=Colletotrichum navitas TaxID=681940 RepID=A0AAD8V9S5_9PEZI|nr:uncharacterized protein LY79DRAFT_388739 [Colletotrichum navitas]KAK1597513.1 hypothetical protein LY79DRAFT_388739 [Colletotrichum navitas]
MVESKCVEVNNAQSSSKDTSLILDNEQWQALIALHRTLLHEHQDFFLASQHPSASPALRRLASKYAMPAIDNDQSSTKHTGPTIKDKRPSNWGRRSIMTPRDFSGKRHHWVEGAIGGVKIQALPDTGAEYNSISSGLADRMGLEPRPGTATQVKLPSGRLIKSPGSIQALFEFAGERRSTLIDCLIIPGCVHDLILSNAFLRATRTLTKFIHRIKSTVCESLGRLRLNLLGSEGRRLQCFINDAPTLALPDTGSNAMLISESFAVSQGMRIDRSPSYCEDLEFADGSRGTTSGIVRGLKWTIGGTQSSIVCDFYVLSGLPVDVVLSGHFLFELQVFSRYEHCMVQHDSAGDVANLYNINLIRKLFQQRIEKEHQVSEGTEITEDFFKKREEDELQFRDEMRGHLDSVPDQDELLTARRLENRRRNDWEELQEQLRQQLRVQTPSDEASNKGPSRVVTRQKKANRFSFFRKKRESVNTDIV